jgi:hypothetical protein
MSLLKKRAPQHVERNAQIIALRQAGVCHKRIATQFGMTVDNTWRIIRMAGAQVRPK